MMTRSLCLLTALFLTAAWQAAMAETAWVTDRIMADVFAEPSADSERVATMMSGEPVELLEGSEGSFIQIRTEGGVSGWIEAAYISMDAPAGEELAELQAEREALAEQVNSLESELANVQEELASVRRQDGTRDQELNQARSQAAAAEEALASYRSQNEEAEERIEALEVELDAAIAAAAEQEEQVLFVPALELDDAAAETVDTASLWNPGSPGATAAGFPLLGLFGLLALGLGGMLGYRLRERQLRKRLGGLSL